MKDCWTWIASGLAGLIFVLLLNTSPLSRLGVGIRLSVGWPEPQAVAICTLEYRQPQGIPFLFDENTCGGGVNLLALVLNGLTGVALSLLFVYVSEKRWPQQDKSAHRQK